MEIYQIIFPDDFDDYAWEVESKGWFNGVVVIFEGKEYRITFYDPVRLSQDVADEIFKYNFFFESNLVVIKIVNRENIEKIINKIVITKQIHDMKIEIA